MLLVRKRQETGLVRKLTALLFRGFADVAARMGNRTFLPPSFVTK